MTEIGGKWFITPHAVRQYIRRVQPQLSYNDALSVLIKVSEQAKRRRTLKKGIAFYRGPRPEKLRCIVCEQTSADRPLPQLLTVYTYKDPDWINREEA
ncbi:MAG: hypothetical protein GX952_03565 [Firmicutes bacterium]|nr:hypothetical protein [Bacillota bacterium]